MNVSFRTLTSMFSSPFFSYSDPSLLPPPPMPPPATSSSSSPSPSAASSISSSSSSSSSSGSTSSSSSLLSASLLASTSLLTPRPCLYWRAPPPSPRRRPLPHQWMHPTTTTPISTTTSTSTLTPTFPPSSGASSTSSLSSVDRATPTSTSLSFSLAPSSHDPITSLRFSALMNDSSTSTFERPPRLRQINPFQRLCLSAPCSPALSSRPSQLVFASGAVGTASGLGHVFGRPLQAKETIPCSALNCTQWQKEPPQSLAQQAQSPSHTFQQQCAVHKRFRLFRQRPRRCQVHASSYHHHSGTTSQGKGTNNGPNYILPPTTVYPLVVRPDKILLDHHEEPPVQESWWPTLTSSISMSSRLSFSTVSLSLSTTNTTTSSTVSFQTHGSEDDESFLSTGGSYPSSQASKKLSKKEKQLQKQLQKQEQQRQQQQQQKLRCLCYLDTSLDNQLDIQQSQQPQQPQKQQHSSQQSKGSSKKSKDKDKEKDREATGRLRRIWNDSVINFHKSKPPGSNGNRQSPSPSPSPSHSSSGYHHTTVTGAGDSSQHSNNSQADAGVPMRHSLSGTDISDEGNHSLSDIEDDLLDGESFRHLRHGSTATPSTSNNSSNYSHHRVSFQGPYGASSNKASSASGASSRPKDDLRAIARHQAELSLQQHQEPLDDNNKDGEDDFRYSMSMDDDEDPDRVLASLPPPPPPVLSSFGSHITENNEEDDEDEDWDIQSDSGAPSSSTLMYSADVREPSCRSTLALPMSANSAHNKAYLKKPSNANLSSLRSRQRCFSLPADTVPPKGGFLKMSSSTPSENWDEDFDISADIHVPTKVVENQMSLQMDLYNIKDFASQIEDLKTLRASLRMASSSLKATNPKKHQDLSMLFQRDWEQAEVIIDLGEIAQTSPTTTSPPGASSSLGSSGKKASEPSLASLSTGAAGGLSSKPSMGFKPRRPALSTSAPANNHLNGLSAFQSIQQTHQARSESQSSSLTGTTLVSSSSGDTESDTCPSTRASSRASSSASASLKVDIEAAVEGLALSHQGSTSPQGTTARRVGGGMRLRQASSMAYMKESCSSPAGLGLCTSPMTPLRTSTNRNSTSSTNDEDYDEYDDDDLEIKYENASIGLLRFPEGEQPLHGGFHNKEDSSATVKPLSSRSPKESGGSGFQAEVEASFRRYQKYSHYSKRRTTGGLPNSRRPTDDHYEVLYDDEEDDEEEEDDGYESYGSSSIGVFTPIPSDRHMQVLKDILMEGLGTEVARQYMFKQGEQDHVRFSVEVIPGLLGHLKGLQQRLGDQLMELQSLTVIV